MPFPDFDPIFFSIGPFAVRWYALAYIAGIILGWRYLIQLCGRTSLWHDGRAPLDGEQADSILLWMTLAIILGGRLGYVLFYNPLYYATHLGDIFAVWHGGMSFHGGAFAVFLTLFLFAWRHGVEPLKVIDLLAAVAPIGLMFGRIANFINAELWGRPTAVAWGVIFPNAGGGARHPSQLYEAVLEGLVILIILAIAIYRGKALHRPGLVGGLFMVLYVGARVGVEFFREPDAHIGFIGGATLGQLLSLPMLVVGSILIVRGLMRPPQ